MSMFRNLLSLITEEPTPSRLPKGYVEVEYIRINSGGFLNMGLTPSNHTTEIDFDFETYLNDEFLLGTNVNYSWNYYFVGAYNNGYSFGHNGSGYTNYPNIWTTGKHHLIYNGENNAIILDGTTLETGQGISSPNTLLIGARNSANFTGKIYYIKITDKSTGDVVRELIPCYRYAGLVVGMYDIINDVFYTNRGSGTFESYPEPAPEPPPTPEPISNFQEVEYIQNQGTADHYINTFYYANVNTKVEFTTMCTDTRTNNMWAQIMGGRNSYHATSSLQVAYNLGSNRAAIDYGTSGTNPSTVFIGKNIKFDVTVSYNEMSIYGTSLTRSGNFSGTSQYPLWIFDENNAGSPEQAFLGRIYSFKIYENDTLVKDFMPCYRKSDNKIGLYEKIGGTFHAPVGNTLIIPS